MTRSEHGINRKSLRHVPEDDLEEALQLIDPAMARRLATERRELRSKAERADQLRSRKLLTEDVRQEAFGQAAGIVERCRNDIAKMPFGALKMDRIDMILKQLAIAICEFDRWDKKDRGRKR